MSVSGEKFTDPVCGMKIDPENAAAVVERDGEKFYFCSEHCRDAFVVGRKERDAACVLSGRTAFREGEASAATTREPASKYFCPMCEGVESDTPGSCPKCGMALERNPLFRAPAKTIYTCPMHPQIEQDHPGDCPICGMALEPKTAVAGGAEENAELRDMTRRLWIGGALSLPVFVLAMSHLLPCRARVGAGRSVALDAIHLEHAGRALGGLAIFPTRLAFDP